MQKLAIGIDLGTTYSSIAICRNGVTEVIPNDHGNRATPSCVTFTKSRKYLGDGAVRQAIENAENSIYGIKRIIGRSFNNPIVQEEIKSWPFKVVNDNNDIKIEVMHKEKSERFHPEEISAMILKYLKTSAEEYLETEIKDVVITCPANFNDSQRQATMDAAKIAGLNVIRMINEPTAAALAYGLKVGNNERKNILVFDFGGGTCDISVLTVKNNKFTIRATKGDTHLGGEDCDKRLVDYFVKKLKKKKQKNVVVNNSFLRQLKMECENTKKVLSLAQHRDFSFEHFHGQITRACFEEHCDDIFETAINLVKLTLQDAELEASEIDEVLLVGGSSRIPKVQEMLSEFFGRNICINKAVNPEEAVAIGAAIQAALLQNQLPENMKGLKLCDICPLSLGFRNFDGSLCVIIKRNTPIPVKVTTNCGTCDDYQTHTVFNIFEGERVMATNNHYLGSFWLSGFLPKPRGASIELTFEIDENGILTVSATEKESGSEASLTVTKDSHFNKDEAEIVVTDAEKLREEDEKHRKRLEALNSLHQCLIFLDKVVQSFPYGEAQREAKEFIEERFEWLHRNMSASKEVFESKEQEIEKSWKKIGLALEQELIDRATGTIPKKTHIQSRNRRK